jgi:hypothetical protein
MRAVDRAALAARDATGERLSLDTAEAATDAWHSAAEAALSELMIGTVVFEALWAATGKDEE